jgi:hypothetical protein
MDISNLVGYRNRIGDFFKTCLTAAKLSMTLRSTSASSGSRGAKPLNQFNNSSQLARATVQICRSSLNAAVTSKCFEQVNWRSLVSQVS